MKIYMVKYEDKEGDGNRGYSYHKTKRLALQSAKSATQCDCEITKEHVRCNAKGILRALNVYGSHADNG